MEDEAVESLFFFQAEDGIRDLVRSRGLGDVYKRQTSMGAPGNVSAHQSEQTIASTWVRSSANVR